MVPMPRRPSFLLLCLVVATACSGEPGSSTEPHAATSSPPLMLTGLAGTYKVEMPITSFDPIWEDLTGYKYTVLLTVQRDTLAMVGSTLPAMGTYTELRLLGPDGTPEDWTSYGLVQGYGDAFTSRTRFGFELAALDRQFHVTMIIDSITEVGINGVFGLGGHISGPFTATRVRP